MGPSLTAMVQLATPNDEITGTRFAAPHHLAVATRGWYTSARSLIFALAIAAQAGPFTLASKDVAPGATLTPAQVYQGYGCIGGNVAPDLHWSGEPAGTRSFALTLFDPDAPGGHGWWHWLVLDLPAGTHALAQASGQAGGPLLPQGARQTRTDFGQPGYGGACPPIGNKPHRYIFTIWALRVAHVGVADDAPAVVVASRLQADALARATLTARFGR